MPARAPVDDCTHHWLIDQLNHGVCKHCGSEKDFPGIADIEEFSWRARHHSDKDPIEGGSDMGDKPPSDLAGLDLDEARVRAAQQPDSYEGTVEELAKAELAGVELKTKSKKEKKQRRHYPDSTLKKVKCTYSGCTLGPDGGPYECDPRALHLHILRQHGVRKHRTPKRIVRRILELFDAGTPQVEIIAALKSQNNLELTSAGICGILNRERPDRVKKSHKRRAPAAAVGPVGAPQEPVNSLADMMAVLRKLTPNALLLEVMKLIVDNTPPEQVRAKALEVKKILSARVAEYIVLSRLLDDVVNYLELTIESSL